MLVESKQGMVDNKLQCKWDNNMTKYIEDLILLYMNMYKANESKQQGTEQLSMHTDPRAKPNIYIYIYVCVMKPVG